MNVTRTFWPGALTAHESPHPVNPFGRNRHTMPRNLAVPRFFLLLFLLAGALSPAWADEVPTRPDPALEPDQVVEAMLAALQKDSEEGLAELYAFSSPGNRERTGPFARFRVMIREGFPDMLGHQAARMAPPLIDQGRAMVPVELISREGGLSRYIFLLSLQHEPDCDGCWMADAVFPPEAMEGFGAPEAPAEAEGPA